LVNKILVVDDEPGIRELVQIILQDEGYCVITAENGVDAVQKVKDELPDMVLLDMVMPGISGLEVCRILKKDASTKFIPIVMFTVLGRDTDVKLAKESGCDGYFLKPFTPEDLVSEVKTWIAKRGERKL
jgi:two-component system alkaline phosphatase synthesis response regulator PhoP